jgi:hypothetical protein
VIDQPDRPSASCSDKDTANPSPWQFVDGAAPVLEKPFTADSLFAAIGS